MSKDAHDLAGLIGPAKTANKRTEENEFCLLARAVDIEKRQIRFLASTGDLDRDGERIKPSAFKGRLDSFMQNPVILAGHQHRLGNGEPSVVGRAAKVWTDKEGLWALVEFAQTPLAELYWQLYSEGFMRAVSVGFIPLEWQDEQDSQNRRVRVYTAVELMEISLVAVPSNRMALSRSKARKKAFVEQKKEGRELEQIEKEMAENGDLPSEKECDEFSNMLLGDVQHEEKTGSRKDLAALAVGEDTGRNPLLGL